MKGTLIAWAQRAERTEARLLPAGAYYLPGSRFAKMMKLARMGASDRVIKRHIKGIEDDTIMVLRKIADGTISRGDGSCARIEIIRREGSAA